MLGVFGSSVNDVGGSASGNVVSISGGTFESLPDTPQFIAGSIAADDSVVQKNNVVDVSAPVDLSGYGIYGSLTEDQYDDMDPATIAQPTPSRPGSGNTLRLSTHGIQAAAMGGFDDYVFAVDASQPSPAPMLTITGGQPTDLGTPSAVAVTVNSHGRVMQHGEAFSLIHNDAGITVGQPLHQTIHVVQGASLRYAGVLENPAQDWLVRVVSAPSLLPQSKAFVESRAAGLGFIGTSVNGADDEGMARALQATGPGSTSGVFGLLRGGHTRYNTGSHVDADEFGGLLGVARRFGRTVVTGFFQAGESRYDTYNAFDGGQDVHGAGRASYYGVGLQARRHWGEAGHVQGAVHVGRVRTSWTARSGLIGRPANFHSEVPYYGLRLGGGYRFALDAATTLEPQASVAWTHLAGDTVKIAGDPYRFAAMDSVRSHVGVQLTHAFSDTMQGYVRAGWEHEFAGEARATVAGMRTASPSLRGDTGVFGLGVSMQPDAKRALTVRLGVSGYTGKRAGVGGTLAVRWRFK